MRIVGCRSRSCKHQNGPRASSHVLLVTSMGLGFRGFRVWGAGGGGGGYGFRGFRGLGFRAQELEQGFGLRCNTLTMKKGLWVHCLF